MASQAHRHSGERHRRATAAVAAALALVSPAASASPAKARPLCAAGKYAECVQALRAGELNLDEDGSALLVRALATQGRIAEAAAAAARFESRFSDSLRALKVAHDVLRLGGDSKAARQKLDRIRALASAPGTELGRAEDLVAAGEAALLLGDEPKAVLSTYFEQAARGKPEYRETYLAAGTLALDKHDDQLAARWFRRGLERTGHDADLRHGLARAYAEGDRKAMLRELDGALHANPRHVGALLLRAEHQIDSEGYGDAHKTLERALAVDPGLPAAWAFRAVLAHLANDPAAEAQARDKALARWPKNPEVDFLIGRKLSHKYRFTEGAAAQRRALAMDAGYLPAKIQLAQDLLRLGQESEGWALAGEVHGRDGYDVAAYNLVMLRDHVAKMTTLKDRHFLLRMDPREATVWGDEALAHLRAARGDLDGRYRFSAGKPVTVEIFADQADFAVRTFGMPGGAGYLGVCFGALITANSPVGNVGVNMNWKAVLWHEYAHVVTLGLTRNKMPRWLSEGISVWEERRRDPTWGQRMSPQYREWILGGELVPVGKLSEAFLAPKTGEHLMFAYFQSALVVEFLVDRFGFEALLAILRDLGQGLGVNAALEAHTAKLAVLEPQFESFAKARAKEPAFDPEALSARAAAARGRKDTAGERKALEEQAAHAADAADAYARLVELAEAGQEWPAVATFAERFVAVNPMSAQAWRALGRAHEASADKSAAAHGRAVTAYRKLLLLDPPDPADVHLRLAKLLRGRDARAAKRHVLDALSEAPRFREAQRLLLDLAGAAP